MESKLNEIIEDAANLIELCGENYKDNQHYKNLVRMVNDQSEVVDGKRICRKGKEILSTSLQNPSDPSSTNVSKNGKRYTGFKLNQEETCDKNNVTNYIINYQVEQNVHSDHQFALETLERHGNNSETKVIIADGAYGSEMTLTVT